MNEVPGMEAAFMRQTAQTANLSDRPVGELVQAERRLRTAVEHLEMHLQRIETTLSNYRGIEPPHAVPTHPESVETLRDQVGECLIRIETAVQRLGNHVDEVTGILG